MNLTTEEKEKIKTYFLIKEGLELTEVTEFYDYLLLKPYGVIPFYDKIYTNTQIQQRLYLHNMKISDISPLSNLSNLSYLNLWINKISDISSLSSLSNLNFLNLSNNKIKDISPLSNLTNLKELYLQYNKITDVSPLSNLTNLKDLNLGNNNISKEQIEEFKIKLPNCNIYYK